VVWDKITTDSDEMVDSLADIRADLLIVDSGSIGPIGS